MDALQLKSSELAMLEEIAAHGGDAREVRRAEAMLWLHEGCTAAEIADRLRVSVQTIYNWINRFLEREADILSNRLADAPRSGRPASAQGRIDPMIAAVIDNSPEEYGYQATVWTAALLRSYLKREHSMSVSPASIQRAMKRLGLRWKRPRHVLSRRSEHWRQSKGGFSVA